MPSHPLLTVGSTGISFDCLGATSATTTTSDGTNSSDSSSGGSSGATATAGMSQVRRRLQSATGPVTTAATVKVSYSLNGSAPVQVGTYATLNANAPPTIKLTQLAAMPDVSGGRLTVAIGECGLSIGTVQDNVDNVAQVPVIGVCFSLGCAHVWGVC